MTNLITTGNLRNARSDFWRSTPEFEGNVVHLKGGRVEVFEKGVFTYDPEKQELRKPLHRN